MTHAQARKRVLVADDDLTFRFLIEQALTEAGFEAVCVEDGQGAIDSVLDEVPDLVFLDNYMPEVTGLDACLKIREFLKNTCPPIIIVTSANSDQHISEAFEAGATDFLVKPVNWHLFQHRLYGWLNSSGADKGGEKKILEKRRCEFLVSRRGDILEVRQNHGYESVISTARVGEKLPDVLPQLAADQILKLVRRVLRTRETRNDVIELDHVSDSQVSSIQVSAKGMQKALVSMQRNVDESLSKSQLFRMAYTAPSTGLPNRHLYALCSKDRLLKAKFQNRDVTFVCLTFDNIGGSEILRTEVMEFLRATISTINDSLVSDARVVKFDVPQADPVCIASLDERFFLMLLDSGTTSVDVSDLSTKITAACEQAAIDTETELLLMPRLGFSRYPNDGDEFQVLLESAHIAAREAIRSGSAICRLDGSPAVQGMSHQNDGEAELIDALEKGLLQIYYQPRVSLQNKRVEAVEALVRWPHALLGQITAADIFSGLHGADAVRRLSDWALREACEQASRWHSAGTPVVISVNLSREQVVEDLFADKTLAIFDDLQLSPKLIELEITDSLLYCSEYASQQFQELCSAGIGLIIDDFGRERIDLQVLRQLEINGFKVDCHQAYATLSDVLDSGVYSIAHAIAVSCGAELIAKNIESSDELDRARFRSCDQAQGFHICQPLSAIKVIDYITEIKFSEASPLDLADAI